MLRDNYSFDEWYKVYKKDIKILFYKMIDKVNEKNLAWDCTKKNLYKKFVLWLFKHSDIRKPNPKYIKSYV